jgi:uncharacterized protein YlxP (DUF503 family)
MNFIIERNMKKILAVTVTNLLGLTLAFAQDADSRVANDRISLFSVPLVCPAAPEIGCGSRSKPALLELECQPGIAEAWLNRTGTVLAIVWSPDSNRESRAPIVQSILEKKGVTATELTGAARETELKNFVPRNEWYRGNQVDTLSKKEAEIIAARLVRRVQKKVELSPATANELDTNLAQVIGNAFVDGTNATPEFAHELLKVARHILDEKGAATFQEAIAKGFRPQAEDNERTQTPDCCAMKATS